MKTNRLKNVILISSIISVLSCGKVPQIEEKELSLTMTKFSTSDNKPFAYFNEETQYIPVKISFKQGKRDIEINEFSLFSNQEVSIFKDLNNNKILDEDERDTLKIIFGKASIDWIDDQNSNDHLTSTYMIYREDGFKENTVISYGDSATASEIYGEKKITATPHSSSFAPSSVVLVSEDPANHVFISQDTESKGLYKTDFMVGTDNHVRILGVDNAIHNDNDTYSYEGLDGEITIHYALKIDDQYYSDKKVTFGEATYEYTLDLEGHDHSVDSTKKQAGMIAHTCNCNLFNVYELDTTNATEPIEPDLNNPDQMMGNQMFRVEWDVTGIAKGRYKVYVHGSTQDKQKDLQWLTKEGENSTHCPSYLRYGGNESAPCTDKTFGETFGTGTTWRWTSDYIFDINIKEGLTSLSINSGNNNGRLNDYNMFIRGLLLVPYSSNYTPNSL